MFDAAAIESALEPLREMLAADGYELALRDVNAAFVVAEITATEDACAECLVPKTMMRAYFESALRPSIEGALPEVRLVYPADIVDQP